MGLANTSLPLNASQPYNPFYREVAQEGRWTTSHFPEKCPFYHRPGEHESPASGFGLPPPSQLDTTTFFCSTTSARESPPCSRSLTPSPIPGKTTTQGALPRATPPLPPPSCAAVPMVPGQKASMTPVRCAAKRLPFHSGALHSSARAAFRVVNAAMSVIDTPFDPCHAETPPPFVPIFPKTHTRASARYPGSFSQV